MQTVHASTPEMAYRGICCFYMPETPVTIRNQETNREYVYTRRLDNNGNMRMLILH